MEKKIYIIIGNIDFLNEKNFSQTFRYGSEEEVIAFCDDNYDREDSDLAIYELEEFVSMTNANCIDIDNSFIRNITK